MNENLCLQKNVGTVDRIIRITIGTLLIIVPAILHSPLWVVPLLAAIGGAQILEGVISY
jgi:hypothetical protein